MNPTTDAVPDTIDRYDQREASHNSIPKARNLEDLPSLFRITRAIDKRRKKVIASPI